MNKERKFLGVALIVVAVIALICGFICSAAGNISVGGSYEASQTYGGDAYTGIQNAAAQTANNVQSVGNGIEDLAECIGTAACCFFIVTAILLFVLGVYNLKASGVQLPSVQLPKVTAFAPAKAEAAPVETPAEAPVEEPVENN